MSELDGAVMGDELDGEDGMEGDELDGDSVVGRRYRRGRLLRLPARPGWRRRDLAPGVHAPGEGLELMALVPDLFGGLFNAANNGAIITFQARPQRPFRSERLLVTVRRVADVVAGVPANIALCDGIFVGTTLSQITRGAFDIENFAPTAFGVRMSLVPAAPGIDISLPVRLFGPALVGTQALLISCLFMGRSIQS
jgi:hypothetical protein